MKLFRIFIPLFSLMIVATGPAAAAEEATWAETVQAGIASLDLSDEQKTAINGAFEGADTAYAEAIAAAREQIGGILTDEQKQGLADMADAEIQRRLEGEGGDRSKSIGEIASDLGVTDTQSSAIVTALEGLGGALDGIDSELLSSIKSILNEEQLAKIASWLQ
jgi:hypothetical protein